MARKAHVQCEFAGANPIASAFKLQALHIREHRTSINSQLAQMVERPRIQLEGTHYQIGFAHGDLLRSQINKQLAIYREIFQQTCKLEWSQIRSIAEEYKESIHKLAPHLLHEMQGIADGIDDAEVDVIDIIALNARSEIALGKWDDGCTSLAWTIREADEGPVEKQILAQNWDSIVSFGENLAMVSIKQDGKPDIWMVMEPGIVGKIGFNSASVGVCFNAIRARPMSTALLPIHLILRICLECATVDSAIETIERLGGAASSQHILIADRNGSRGLELSPLGAVYLQPDSDGVLVHSNHFLGNKLVDEHPWLSGSPFRLQKIRTLCANLTRELDSKSTRLGDGITPGILRQNIFSDRDNSPQAICCSFDPDAKIQTLFNIVMSFEPGRGPTAEVVFGQPGGPDASNVFSMPW